MAIKDQIKQNLNSSLKERKEIEVSVLRQLLAAFLNKEKAKRFNLSKEKPDLSEEGLEKESTLVDEEVMDVISSEIKKRREAVELYEKGNRPELANKEKKEIEVLQKYLPAQLSEGELRKIVEETIKETGASSIKDMGKVMAVLMPKTKGKADNSLAGKIVKEFLV
ncbi:MAG: GatB/YqeY domain-containing protein [Candidatus Pacebacteria bacterium]|nr:GatB/YqeY domain-containing protein [Candidatus Paceibacterota bacterium]